MSTLLFHLSMIRSSQMLARTCLNASVRKFTAKKSSVCHQYLDLRPRVGLGHVGNQQIPCSSLTTKTPHELTSNSADKPASSSGNVNGLRDRLFEKMTTGRVGQWVSAFEEFLGIGDVKRAQAKLIQLELKFMEARKDVTKSSDEVDSLRGELRTIRAKLDRTSRDDPQFLDLATEEHHLLQSETRLREWHDKTIATERTVFQEMGTALRDSYEKQRVQEERSKYWSLMLGLATGVIAFIGSSYINHRRMRTLQTMVIDQIHAITGEGPGGGDVGTALESLANEHNARLEEQTKLFQELFSKQDNKISEELDLIRRTLGMEGVMDPAGVEEVLTRYRYKWEWEVKMSTISTVVLVYGAFALTLPILYAIFK